MSKQFAKGSIYVFTKKKFIESEGKKAAKENIWCNYINGNQVLIQGHYYGKCKCFRVDPLWCKCIVNNSKK